MSGRTTTPAPVSHDRPVDPLLNPYSLLRNAGAGGRTRTDMNRDTEDWKDADPDIPELIEARERLGDMEAEEGGAG